MKRLIIFLMITLFISHCAIVSAEEDEIEYTAHDKLSRGAFNMITSVFEIPIAMHKISVEENAIIGVLYGLPVGIGKGCIRSIVGLVEVTTFPFPPYDPIVEPEFLFFERER